MFKRWFSRSNKSGDASPRGRSPAIEAATPEGLAELAKTDTDPEVRKAAIARLENIDQLKVLLDDAEVHSEVARRLGILATTGHPLVDDPDVFQAYASAASESQLAELLTSCDDVGQLAVIAVAARGEVKQSALAHPVFQTSDGLTRLERASRGRDKQCNQFARKGLAEIKVREENCATLTDRLREIDEALERIKHEDLHNTAIQQKLTKLRTSRHRVVEDLNQLEPNLELPNDPSSGLEIPEAPEPKQAAEIQTPDVTGDLAAANASEISTIQGHIAEGRLTEARSARAALAEKLDGNETNTALGEALISLDHKLSRLEAAFTALAAPPWSDLSDSKESDSKESGPQEGDPQDGEKINLPPSADPQGKPEAIKAAIQAHKNWANGWRKAIKALRWPDDSTPPAKVDAITTALARCEAEIQTLNAALEGHKKTFNAALERAETALEADQYQPAINAIKEARALFRHLNFEKADRTDAERKLTALSSRISELKDWQTFATHPKRDALIEEVRVLAAEPQEPPTQASRLKSLREQWRGLGRPSSKEEWSLQEKFDALAEEAYQPCIEYFAEQERQRAENLERRTELCAQLKSYIEGTEWEQADIKAAESIMRTARDEWRRHHPCERKALKPVEAQFEALQARLHAHIKNAWDGNIQRKKDIIDETKALLEQPLDTQVAGAKRLQAAWRDVGPTPRGVDQRLWKEFRAVCDQVFANRNADQERERVAQEGALATLTGAIEQLEHAIQACRDGTNTASQQDFRALNEGIERANADLPMRQPKEIERRTEAARREYRDLLQQSKQAAVTAEIDQWERWEAEVSHVEHAEAAPTTNAPHPVFESRLAGAGPSDVDLVRLVLIAEIAADLQSESHQSERMALQIEMMNQGQREVEATWQELVAEWCAAPKTDHDAAALSERFFRAIRQRAAPKS